MSNHAMLRSIPPLFLCLIALSSLPARAVQTETRGIHAVPAPAKVAIDGDLKEWDLSGSVLVCYDVESLRDVYSGDVAMMHDAENLYVGIRWKDPVPLGNSHDPRFQANKGWAGDAVQLRFKTDRIAHLTAWGYSRTGEPAIQIDYGKSLTEPFGGGQRLLLRTEGVNLPDGAAMAFRKDADGRGYVQEIRLPWPLIATRSYKAGERFACGVELLWGEADWPVHRYADNLAEGTSSREFFWTAHNGWGPVVLEPKGKLKLPTPSYLQALQPEPQNGPVEIRYELPGDARVSLAVEDAQGRRVRNLVPALPRKKGHNVERWDGLDDDGKPVPPGSYRFKALYHDGIHVRWLMSFASPGNPTWDTPDGKGAFYGDHTEPQAVAAAGEYVALACPMGEAGKHLIGCDLNGQRLWGLANRAAFDGGRISLATDGKILWVAIEGKRATIYRVEIATGRYSPWSRTARDESGRESPVLDYEVSDLPGMQSAQNVPANLTAVAYAGGTLAVCLAREDAVKLMDASTGDVRATLAAKNPRSVVSDGSGGWIVLSEGKLLRFDTQGTSSVFSEDGADGYSLARDAAGDVYLSRRGEAMNVAVYSPDGKRLREIGKRGGRPHDGPYDPAGMRLPAQIAIDSRGRLWVAEETHNPKRTSVWNPSGTLEKELVGTVGYAAAGAINPFDPTMAFADDTVYRIDLATGAWKPVYSLGRRNDPDDIFPPSVHSTTSRAIVRDGLTYVYTTGSARGAGEVHCTVLRNGEWRSAAHVGTVNRRERQGAWVKYFHPFFDGHDGEVYAWADANGDGLVQAAELTFAKPEHEGAPLKLRSYYWGQLPDAAGTIPYIVQGASAIVKITISGYTPVGAPIYDVARPQIVKTDRPLVGLGNGEGMLLGGSAGRVYLNQDPIIAVEPDGRVGGGYPSRHTSVHGSHTARSARPGYIIGPSSILGVADMGGDVGEVFYLNGNLGENYLFTHDGLFIQSLFKDVRGWFETPTQAVRGMAFDAATAGGESFGGNFVRTPDGKTLVVLGGTDARVLEVTGLDTIRRLSGNVTVTPATYAKTLKNVEERAVKAQETRRYRIARSGEPIAIDGKATEWPELTDDARTLLEVQESARERFGRVQMRWDDENLYLAYRVFARRSRMTNVGQDYRLLFKTGDAVDLMIRGASGDGGRRLLLTTQEGKPTAVLYEKTVKGVRLEDRVPFSSPWRTITFDRVTRPETVRMATGPIKDGYFVEAAVPWTVLGMQPGAGLKLRGDVGLLFVDSGGTQTAARRYWSNRATGLVNDIPGEADLAPSLWGDLELE